MKTIRRIVQSDITRKDHENVVQLKVQDATEYQSSGGYNYLIQHGFYFRRPRTSF